MYGLRRPLSLQFYCLNDSYISPYFPEKDNRKKKDKPIALEDLYSEPKIDNELKNEKKFNLRFYTSETGQIVSL